MAMQSGMGLSKIIIIAGAGYTGAIVLKDKDLSDIVGLLQALLKKNDKSGDGVASKSDTLASQIHQLSSEVSRLARARPITVLNGSTSESVNVTSLILPAAVLGTVGYGYMWWKGISFSDMMYVTKKNMKTAVTSMTKHLEDVKSAVAAAKKHLSQRIENLDLKVDEQREITKMIKNEVQDTRGDLLKIGANVNKIHNDVNGLDIRLDNLEDKLDITTIGVLRLCKLVDGSDEQIDSYVKTLQTPRRSAIDFERATNLKDITKLILSSSSEMNRGDGIVDRKPKPVTRMSIKC